jgi:hypothetical protein
MTVPIRVNHIKHHVYDIEFEPNSTSSYVLKAKAKGAGGDSSKSTKLFDEFNMNSRRQSSDSNKSNQSAGESSAPQLRKRAGPRVAPHFRNSTGSSDLTSTTYTTFTTNYEDSSFANMPRKSTFSQISSLEDILEKTKTEIYRKLNDLKAAAIKVQLEVESDKPVEFEVTKAKDGQPVEFQPFVHPNNRHVIYFNYDQIVDFAIGVRNKNLALGSFDENAVVNAQIDGISFFFLS